MLEKSIASQEVRGKGQSTHRVGDAEKAVDERKMTVTAIVAMIEIWMSDLWCVRLSAIR